LYWRYVFTGNTNEFIIGHVKTSAQLVLALAHSQPITQLYLPKFALEHLLHFSRLSATHSTRQAQQLLARMLTLEFAGIRENTKLRFGRQTLELLVKIVFQSRIHQISVFVNLEGFKNISRRVTPSPRA
jgi:hypothetical protein